MRSLSALSSVFLQIFALIFLASSLSDCGGGAHTGTPGDPNVQADSVTISISPSSATIAAGASQQFTATIAGTSDRRALWNVDGISNGNAAVGTVSTTGLYKAPGTAGTHKIGITSSADSSKHAFAVVTVTSPPPKISITLSPGTATIGTGSKFQFTAAVTGSSNLAVSWAVDGVVGGNSSVGTITTAGLYVAPSTPGTHTVMATSSADMTKTSSAVVTVTPATNINVFIHPRTVSLTFTQTQQFSATVTGSSNTSVDWLVDDVSGGNSTVGTISSSGLYTPPAAVGKHTITARSQADSSKTATAASVITDFAGAFTYQYANTRTGENLNEKLLSPATVNSSNFGRLFSYALDGWSFAQPLYVSNISIPGLGSRNVVYAVTMHDSVYAFDADGKQSSPYWHRNFLDPSDGVTSVPGSDVNNVYPEIGILATPVIDPDTETLYVVAMTKESGAWKFRLHALDTSTGSDKFGSPVEIEGSVSGSGADNVGGKLSFNARIQMNRPALLLSNGIVYVAFGSYQDNGPYHGWIFGYAAQNLSQSPVILNTTRNGFAGAIWQAGCGIAADSSGNLFVGVANGKFDASSGGPDFGDSILKLTNTGSDLSVADYFTPFDQSTMNSQDADMGSGGTVLLPEQSSNHPHVAITPSKDGNLYVVDRDNLGHIHSGDNAQAVQVLSVGPAWTSPAYWNGLVYMGSSGHPLKSFRTDGGLLATGDATPHSFGYPGVTPVISADGTADGVVWVLERVDATNAIVLRAYNASDVSHELYNSTQAGTRDTIGIGTRFEIPLVANGKVYVGTTKQLIVFGMLP